jgi:hypothetical protein
MCMSNGTHVHILGQLVEVHSLLLPCGAYTSHSGKKKKKKKLNTEPSHWSKASIFVTQISCIMSCFENLLKFILFF